MVFKNKHKIENIEYVGIPSITKPCQDAVLCLLQFRERIQKVLILTHNQKHGLLITIAPGHLIAVKSGFATGYGGEGPRRFSYILSLLDNFGLNQKIEEIEVDKGIMKRLNGSDLTYADLENIKVSRPIRPLRFPEYIWEKYYDIESDESWLQFPPIIPFAIVDNRIRDLAIGFWEDPDKKLMDGYRRLEEMIRKQTGINEVGASLFSKALLGNKPVLYWKNINEAEKRGRASLFTGCYLAYRNPRAHNEKDYDPEELVSEFLILNHLYRLQRQLQKNPA